MTVKQEAKMFKEWARNALLRTYGFAPNLNQITLLESYFDGAPKYVLFSIGWHRYSYDGISLEKDA